MIITKKILDGFLSEELERYHNATKQIYKFKFKDKIKKALFSYLGSGKKEWIPPTKKIDGNKIKNIVIFRYDAIGDYFITTSAIRWLKKALPEANIDIITSYRNQSIAENDPYINKAEPLKSYGKLNLSSINMLKSKRNIHYDLTIAMIFSKTTKSAIMSHLIAPDSEKIAVNHNKRTQIYGLVFNRLCDSAVPGLSWAEKMLNCVTDNIEPVIPVNKKDFHPYIYIKEKSYNNILKIIKEYNLNYQLHTENVLFTGENPNFYKAHSGNKYCVINIAGTEANRIWDNKNVINYCTELTKQYPDLKVFISGGPAYKGKVAELIDTLNLPNCIALNVGLQEFIAFCAGAYFVVTPDTGVVHFTAAANVPLIVLYADKSKVLEWFPHNTEFISLLTPDRTSINYIPIEEVIEATGILVTNIS